MPRLPTVAALTVVKDEARMLPLWLSHYGERLGLDHLVVLDDDSTDGCIDGVAQRTGAEVRHLRLPGGAAFERARIAAANRAAEDLLERFDWVVFTDADELLVVDPRRHDSYRHLLASATAPVLAPIGLNVVHRPRGEPDLDLSVPILGQRRFAYLAQIMSKPGSKRVPAGWRLASHGITTRYEVRRDLFCVHLKFADRALLQSTSAHRRALNESDGRGGGTWRKDDVAHRFRRQMRETDFGGAAVFDPDAVDLDALCVSTQGGAVWRSPQSSQMADLRGSPVLRLPRWLRGTV